MLAKSGWHERSQANSQAIESSHRANVSKQWLAREISSELTCYRIKPSAKISKGWLHEISQANSQAIESSHQANVSKQWLAREISSELTRYQIKPSGKC
jgi:hypothetical protein